MNNINFGKIIAKLRKEHKMTQCELAKQLNISDKAVSKWESGNGYPDITQLPAISEIFGVSIDYLLKGNPKGIAIAGNIIADVVNMIDKYPKKEMIADVLKTQVSVGGCVPNTIIDLAKLDSDLSLTAYGKIGQDEHGRFVMSQLKKYGINVDNIKMSGTMPTSVSNVMTEISTGSRTFFANKGANSEFGVDDIDVSTLECDMFHIGYILLLDALDAEDDEYGTKMARLLHDVQQRGIRTSIDTVSEDSSRFAEKIVPALKYCDNVIMNETECCRVTGVSPRNEDGTLNIENVKNTMKYFIECGVKERVIVHSAEAGFLYDSDGNFETIASLKLPDNYIKGSVGAGDAFAAGSLYGLYKGYDNKKILEFASCAAACSLGAEDAISAMKSKEDVEKFHVMYERGVL